MTSEEVVREREREREYIYTILTSLYSSLNLKVKRMKRGGKESEGENYGVREERRGRECGSWK